MATHRGQPHLGSSERRHLRRSTWADVRWWVIAALFAVAAALGAVGFRQYDANTGSSEAWSDVLYRVLQLFVLESGDVADPDATPPALHVARLLAPAAAVLLVHQALATLFREQLQLLRLRRARGHVVVCGLGERGLELGRSLAAGGRRVVVVEIDGDEPKIETCRELRVPVLIGDATDVAVLRRARVAQADRIVALCGDDAVNAKIAAAATRLADERGEPLRCHIHLFDPHLCGLLRSRHQPPRSPTGVRLEFFNTFEQGAQSILLRHRPFPERFAAGDPARAHVLVVGLGWLGESLVVQAARNWRAAHPALDGHLWITVVDIEAEALVDSLVRRHPVLTDVARLQGHSLDVRSPEFEQGAPLAPAEGPAVSAAYVCLDDDSLALSTALVLHGLLRDEVPIVIRARTADGLPALLGPTEDDEFERLRAFPLIERVSDPELLFGGTDELIARALHDVYLQRQEAAGWRFGPERDDEHRRSPAMAPWEALDDAYRTSNRHQAAHIHTKLAAIGCTLTDASDAWEPPIELTPDEVEALAELEHDRFVQERRAQGWTSGPASLATRRSPHLGSWAELSEEMRDYDRDFVRSLPMVLAKVGLRVVRLR